MPNDALMQFLSGINANSIVKIELIHTPPAQFDAQGNAGFINIVLKSNTDEGLKGSYTLTSGYGKGFLGNAGFNLNFRKGKTNLYSNYSYTFNSQEQFTTLNRIIGDLSINLKSERDPIRNNHIARIGLDYEFSKKTTAGVLFSGYDNKWDMHALNTIIEKSPDQLKILSQNREDNDWKHLQTNLNLVHLFSNGGQFYFDLDYLVFKNENPTTYDQSFQYQNDPIISKQKIFSNKATPFNITVGKLDYVRPIDDKLNFSIGGKFVSSNFDNNVLVTENNLVLSDFTNETNLKETIMATYSDIDFQLSEKYRLKLGLRYEHTDTELNASNGGKVVDRQFGGLFPSLFFNYQINAKNHLNLSLSKRINRPSFSDMAPFVIFLSPNTFFGGNSELQPSIAKTIKANYQFKTINFSIQYTQEDSTIVRFQNQFDRLSNTQIISPNNLSQQRILSASIAFPLEVNKWWSMRLFGIYVQQSVFIADQDLGSRNLKQINFRLNGSHSFKLPLKFKIELSGFYQSTSLNGNVKFIGQRVLNFGIQKKLSSQAQLTLNVNDIFNSLKAIGDTEIPDEEIFVNRSFDFSQRTFKLTYSHKIGNQKLKNNRKRSNANDEKGRVN